MHRRLLQVVLFAAVLFALPVEGVARNNKEKPVRQEKVRKEKAEENKVEHCTLYVFGVSFSFSDSLVYMTDIQTMENMEVYSNYFLTGNEAYSNQMKHWLEQGGAEKQVSSLYFFRKSKKADRKYEKVRNRVVRKRGRTVVTIPQFKFSPLG